MGRCIPERRRRWRAIWSRAQDAGNWPRMLQASSGVHGADGRGGCAAGIADTHHPWFHALAVKPGGGAKAVLTAPKRWMELLLQPRMRRGGMGVATPSFFGVGGRGCANSTPSDLDPVKVWTAAENRASRAWERGVKSYENLRLVYDIETRLSQWREETPPALPTAKSRGSRRCAAGSQEPGSNK